MSLRTRSHEKELLDGDHIPFADLLVNLDELKIINSLLGGHKVTCQGLDFFLAKMSAGRPLAIAEIGCGGGDNLFAIEKYLVRKKRHFTLTGIDMKPECIRYASASSNPDIGWICSDYRDVEWQENKPDIIFSSLFCHHFTDEELVEQILWLKDNSKMGFFINDLHRHQVAYYSIKVISRLFSRSYLLRNDAPLSVKRSFKRSDWITILSGAGIQQYDLNWRWAFRYLICVKNEQ